MIALRPVHRTRAYVRSSHCRRVSFAKRTSGPSWFSTAANSRELANCSQRVTDKTQANPRRHARTRLICCSPMNA